MADLFHVKLLQNLRGRFVSREIFEVRIGSFFMSHVNFLRSASKPATFERVADEKPFFVSRETKKDRRIA